MKNTKCKIKEDYRAFCKSMKTTSSVILSPFVIFSINFAKNLSVPLRACPEFIEGINFAKNLILSISYETLYRACPEQDSSVASLLQNDRKRRVQVGTTRFRGDTFRTFARASIIKI
ncbi:MAG: hypothetical protein V3S49_01510 [Thermodesulfobacteriota bacterium]